MAILRLSTKIACRAMIWAALLFLTAPTVAASDGGLSAGQTVYVPIYSHIYSGDKENPFLLTAILSIRNTDFIHTITVTAIEYYDTDGKLLKSYIEKPVQLKPMGSTRYVVAESDKSGGSGAKFIVRWVAVTAVNPPVIEGIMIGTKMQQGISFVSRGQVIYEPGQ